MQLGLHFSDGRFFFLYPSNPLKGYLLYLSSLLVVSPFAANACSGQDMLAQYCYLQCFFSEESVCRAQQVCLDLQEVQATGL